MYQPSHRHYSCHTTWHHTGDDVSTEMFQLLFRACVHTPHTAVQHTVTIIRPLVIRHSALSDTAIRRGIFSAVVHNLKLALFVRPTTPSFQNPSPPPIKTKRKHGYSVFRYISALSDIFSNPTTFLSSLGQILYWCLFHRRTLLTLRNKYYSFFMLAPCTVPSSTVYRTLAQQAGMPP